MLPKGAYQHDNSTGTFDSTLAKDMNWFLANIRALAFQWFRYHIFSRQNQFNTLIHGQRLFQQLLCDMYACVDDNVLNWHRNNQDLIRSDLYRGVIDALRTDEPVRNLGQPVILAASYHGGDRHMTKCYQVSHIFIQLT